MVGDGGRQCCEMTHDSQDLDQKTIVQFLAGWWAESPVDIPECNTYSNSTISYWQRVLRPRASIGMAPGTLFPA